MKVVFIEGGENKDIIYPEIGEIVTVLGQCHVYSDSWDIAEYPVWKCGTPQSLEKRLFRLLDDSFATSVLEKVTEQIKEEELVNG